ncbi:hypothetical protein C7E25_25205, partial [Stenotrophomonas maltophilia]
DQNRFVRWKDKIEDSSARPCWARAWAPRLAASAVPPGPEPLRALEGQDRRLFGQTVLGPRLGTSAGGFG